MQIEIRLDALSQPIRGKCSPRIHREVFIHGMLVFLAYLNTTREFTNGLSLSSIV
jgi:hypothetical protein